MIASYRFNWALNLVDRCFCCNWTNSFRLRSMVSSVAASVDGHDADWSITSVWHWSSWSLTLVKWFRTNCWHKSCSFVLAILCTWALMIWREDGKKEAIVKWYLINLPAICAVLIRWLNRIAINPDGDQDDIVDRVIEGENEWRVVHSFSSGYASRVDGVLERVLLAKISNTWVVDPSSLLAQRSLLLVVVLVLVLAVPRSSSSSSLIIAITTVDLTRVSSVYVYET